MESLWARNLAKPSADVARGQTNAIDFTVKYGTFWPLVSLAKLYDEGPGVKRDIDKAIVLYAKATAGLGSEDDWSKQKLRKLRKEAQTKHH